MIDIERLKALDTKPKLKNKTVSVYLDPTQYDKLEYLCKELKLSKNQVMIRLLQLA